METELNILTQLQTQFEELYQCYPLVGPAPFQDNGVPLHVRYGSLMEEIEAKKAWLKIIEN